MGIELITARILGEAKEEAAAIRAKAEEEAKARQAEAEKTAASLTADTAAKAKTDAEVLLERKKSVAELEARKMRLAARQEMISKSFDETLQAIQKLPEKDYLNFLVSGLAPYSEGEVVLNAADKKKIGSALAKKLEGTGLTVSEKTADIKGGFLLVNGSVSMNGSLESILESEKKMITAQISGVLFS